MKFKAQIYVKKKEEGGRRIPFFSGYQPILVSNGIKYSCTVYLINNVEMMVPGSKAEVEIDVDAADINNIKSFHLIEQDHITVTGTKI
jgi:translation elongation factor EF-Tu-like GTPase